MNLRLVALVAFLSVAACRGSSKSAESKPAPASVTVTISVDSDPAGATVSVDGKDIGITPLKAPVAPGPHKVGISKEGFIPHLSELKIGPNLPASFKATLIAAH